VREQLANLGRTFSHIDADLKRAVRHPKDPTRETPFTTDQPAAKANTDLALRLGRCYFDARNQFLRGRFREIAEPLTGLVEMTSRLADCCHGLASGAVSRPDISAERIAATERALRPEPR